MKDIIKGSKNKINFLLYNNGIYKQYDWKNHKTGFVVSSGRTGTNFFESFFNENFSNVYAKHEPTPQIYSIGKDYLTCKISLEKAEQKFTFNRQKVLKHIYDNKIENYVESNPAASLLIPVIKKAVKNYKIVWVVRNGVDYLRSAYSKHNIIRGQGSYFYDNNDPVDRITAINLNDQQYMSIWNDLSRFEKVCWHWIKINQIIEQSAKDDSSILMVKFEDIFYGSKVGLDKIIEFFGLNENQVKDIKQIKLNKKNTNEEYLLEKDFSAWDSKKKDIFKRIAGDSMIKYGYDF